VTEAKARTLAYQSLSHRRACVRALSAISEVKTMGVLAARTSRLVGRDPDPFPHTMRFVPDPSR